MGHSIKQLRKEFKSNGVFYTPKALSEYMKSLIDIDILDVYDPTCGDGSLLSVFDDNVMKFGQEKDSAQFAKCKNNLINFTGICGDTLTSPAFIDKRFSCIVANPPFSIKWNPPDPATDIRFKDCGICPPPSKADYAFILHILHVLSNDGIAIVLCFPGILYRGGKELLIRKYLIEQAFIDKIISIPAKTFEDTSIGTVILIFKKNKIDKDIEIVDKTNGRSVFINIDQIRENDYNLSINLYITDVYIKETVDPILLQEKARINFIDRFIKELEFDKMVCEFEGLNHLDYINKLKTILNNYE